MKCPFPDCGKINIDNDHQKAETYARNYGGGMFIFQCEHCRKIYSVNFHVVITHDKPCIEPGLSVVDLSYS